MLYSLLVAVMVLSFLMAFLTPYITIKYFIKGLNLEIKKSDVRVKEPSIMKTADEKKSERKQSEYMSIMENIDRYDGTPFGQGEID